MSSSRVNILIIYGLNIDVDICTDMWLQFPSPKKWAILVNNTYHANYSNPNAVLAACTRRLRNLSAAVERGVADKAESTSALLFSIMWRVISINCCMGISVHELQTLTKSAFRALCTSATFSHAASRDTVSLTETILSTRSRTSSSAKHKSEQRFPV